MYCLLHYVNAFCIIGLNLNSDEDLPVQFLLFSVRLFLQLRFQLMSLLRSFIIFVMFGFPGIVCAAEKAADVDAMQEVGDARLRSASVSILWASERIKDLSSVSGKDCHVALQQIAQKQTDFRSLLAIDQDGQLYCDSYNRFRIFSADLSSRSYFLNGRLMPLGDLKIHEPVVGKQSGIPFIPITSRTSGNAVIVATFEPSRLIPVRTYCVTCGALVVHEGKVIAVSARLNSANEDVAARMSFDGAYGQKDIVLRGMNVSIEWKRSELFNDLIYVTYKGEFAAGGE